VNRSSSIRRFPLVATRWPARQIVTRSGSIPRGYFPSAKNGQMVAYEQLLEADAVVLFEMSPLIKSYVGQPEKIYYPDGDRTRLYTPDFRVDLIDGSRILVEIKPERCLAPPDVKHKFERIQEHLDRLAKPFTILTDKSIRQQPRLENLRTLLRDPPLLQVTSDTLRRSLFALARSRIETLGEATALVGKDVVFTLLSQGRATCPLDQEITSCTPFQLTSETQNDWFLFAERHGF